LKAVHFGTDVVGPIELNGINGRMFALANESDLENLGVRLRMKRRDVLELRTVWDRDGIPNHLWRVYALRHQEPRPYRLPKLNYRERKDIKPAPELKESWVENGVSKREDAFDDDDDGDTSPSELIRRTNISVECIDSEEIMEAPKTAPLLNFNGRANPATFGFPKKTTNLAPRYDWYSVAVSIIDTDAAAAKSEKHETALLQAAEEVELAQEQEIREAGSQDCRRAEDADIRRFSNTGDTCETIPEDDWEWLSRGSEDEDQEDYEDVLTV
jgi:hypothetical protein